MNDRINGETVVSQSTSTSYYVEYEHEPDEWRRHGPSHQFATKAHQAADNLPWNKPTRIVVHTRHIMDVDTYIAGGPK